MLATVEPPSLIDHFVRHPPVGFEAERLASGVPSFLAPYDLLTTLDEPVRRRVCALPLYPHWRAALTWRARFIGTTVTEYAPLPETQPAAAFARELIDRYAREAPLLIVKDLACDSPLLDAHGNAYCEQVLAALEQVGFVPLQGMSLAWLPIDFPSVEAYLARMSPRRRADLRRKLRVRPSLEVLEVPAGADRFGDPGFIDELYRLYEAVYAQSEVHFDLLQREFFGAVLRDAGSGGVLFLYRREGRLLGWKLCFEYAGRLIDKYVGFDYPAARDNNLYFISWFHCLEYALRRGLTHLVAGWTDARVKAYLGARMARTRHAVYVRNPALRFAFRRLAHRFESEPGY